MSDLEVVVEVPRDDVLNSAVRILARELLARAAVRTKRVRKARGSVPALTLTTSREVPPEGFRIVRESPHAVRIIGGDSRGVLYGCGRFLRRCGLGAKPVALPSSEAPSKPDKPFRGIYFAVHMYNYYHNAPLQ